MCNFTAIASMQCVRSKQRRHETYRTYDNVYVSYQDHTDREESRHTSTILAIQSSLSQTLAAPIKRPYDFDKICLLELLNALARVDVIGLR